jgi:hypothetical protein
VLEVNVATPNLEYQRLSAPEKAMLIRELQRTDAYFEFGMGGSSLLAVRAGVRQMVLVDSDASWVAGVRRHPEIAPRCADGSVSALHADIGPVREWGAPADRASLAMWNAYLAVGWEEWARRKAMPDLVFVDGRFRVACCISVALANMQQQPPAEIRVLMHDVCDERPHYRDALEFFEQVELVDTLMLMKPRSDVCSAFGIGRLLRRQFDFS